MKLAVIMSTYNGESFLSEQIESIMNQDLGSHIDLFVRDDGSRDRTPEILDDYQSRGILKWYQGENAGPAFSFIDLLYSINDYDYCFLSDQDDVWYPDKMRSAVETLNGIEGPALYFCNARLVDEDLNSLDSLVYNHHPHTNMETIICAPNTLGCSVCINRELHQKIIRRRKPEVITMHDSYITRVCSCIGGTIYYDERVHLDYRQHSQNVIGLKNSVSGKIRDRVDLIFKKAEIGIDEQANEILSIYQEDIPQENAAFLKEVADYRKNLLSRIRLAFSGKTHYISTNMSFSTRASILLKNR